MDGAEKKSRIEYDRTQAARRAEQRRRQRQKKERLWRLAFGIFLAGMVAIAAAQVFRLVKSRKAGEAALELPVKEARKIVADPPAYDVQLLDVNQYSRPGTALEEVKGIVIHYTANPGTTAQQNRDYFQGLSQSGEAYASSHFVIGLEGELIQCIPCQEVAYASNDRNRDTLSVECCIPDESGRFSDATYGTLVHLVAWLMGRYDLEIDDVIRHYDVTGKNCPKYYVEHEDAWERFKEDVCIYIESYGTAEAETESAEIR